MTDCRRTQQLEYFGEHFSREQCLENRATACDNCLRTGQYKETDVTEQAMIIVRGVRDLCSGRNRFTILHMSDVLKGASIQKIMDNRHNLNACYGKLKNWEKMDIQRLMHKMVIEQYLQDEMIFTNEIVQAYIRVGPRVEHLMNNRTKVMFSLADKMSKNAKQVEVSSSEDPFAKNSAIVDVVERCYQDLVEIVTRIAGEKGCAVSSIMNMQALKVS
jgi:bloom syndrome protein